MNKIRMIKIIIIITIITIKIMIKLCTWNIKYMLLNKPIYEISTTKKSEKLKLSKKEIIIIIIIIK